MLKHQVAGKKYDCFIINKGKYQFNGSSIKKRGTISWVMFIHKHVFMYLPLAINFVKEFYTLNLCYNKTSYLKQIFQETVIIIK
jgi:hypothetical protein